MEQTLNAKTYGGLVKLIISFLSDTWAFFAKPFSPQAWKTEMREISTLTPQIAIKRIIAGLPKLLIYYVLLSPLVAMPLYNTMLFHPYVTGDFNLKSINGVPCENVYFNSENGKRLHGWLFKLPHATKTVVISHGNAGNIIYREGLVSILLSAGASVLVYDYQGFGKSQGNPSIDGICQDATAAYKYLVNNLGVKPSNVILFGESVGTGAACYVAAHNPCGGIILQSAYTSLPDIAKAKLLFLRAYPLFLFPPNKLDNLSILKQAHPPLLLVHGKQDNIIPFTHSETLYAQAAAPKQLELLPHASHNDIYDVDTYQYEGALSRFIGSLK